MCHPAIFTALSGGAITAGTAGTLAVASGIGLAGFSIYSAKQTEKASNRLAEQAYRDDMEQIKDNRVAVLLETSQKGNVIAENFARKAATNRALLSPSGIAQSNSFEAAVGFNKSAFHQELNIIAIQAARKQRELTFAGIDARQQLTSTKIANKNAFNQQMIKSISTLAASGAGLPSPSSSPSMLNPNTTATMSAGQLDMGIRNYPVRGY